VVNTADKQHLQCVAKRLLQILIIVFAGGVHAVSVPPHWQQDAYLTDSFIEIALKREYLANKKTTLHRWQKPLKIFINSKQGDPSLQRKMYQIQARHLQLISGHTLSFVQSPLQANVFIVFTSSAEMKDNALKYAENTADLDNVLKNALCMASIESNNKSEIIRGVILIPVDSARQRGRLIDCVVEELTQLMGLPNDSSAVYPSIFNDRSIDRYLTGLDYLLLKIAYHPLLKPGMSEAQIREKLPAILAELRLHGEIKNAQWRAFDNSIKKWMTE